MLGIDVAREPGRATFRAARPPVSGVVRPRLVVVWWTLAALASFTFCLTIAIGTGDYPVSLVDVVRALAGSGDRPTLFAVQELRLPRASVAALAGAAFGAAGAVFQSVTRNPLASPDLLGVTQGAGTAVAASVALGIGSAIGTEGMGLIGGLTAGVLMYVLAWNRGTTGYRIVLVGIALSWMCVSLTYYLLSRAETYQAQKIVGWLVGNLNDRGWPQAKPLAVTLLVLLPVVLLLGRLQRTTLMGDEVAGGLGTPVQRLRMVMLLCGAALAAFATAAAGPVMFVALAAPQIAQRLARAPAPPVTAAALTGATIVLVSDLISQRMMDDMVMPVGVVTGVLGAPFLLWQLARANKVGSGG